MGPDRGLVGRKGGVIAANLPSPGGTGEVPYRLTKAVRNGATMPALPDFKVSPAVQPKPEDYGYDLDKALASVVGLRAIIPNDAFTAETLGTERAGNGVLITSAAWC